MIDSDDRTGELPPADWMAPRRSTDGFGLLTGWLVTLLGMVVMFAAFLPWGSVVGWGDPVTYTGMQAGGDSESSAGPGLLTLCAGVVAFVLGIVRGVGALPRTSGVLNLLAGGLITWVAYRMMTSPPLSAFGVPLPSSFWQVEVGLWLTLPAGIGIMLLASIGFAKRD